MDTTLKVPWTEFIPHQPTAKQLAFLLLDTPEALYGGAAGGGKSDALLMAALQYANVPNYAALLLRKTYSDLALPGALMSRSMEWLLPTEAHWKAAEKTWVFPSGATLTFGYLDTIGSEYRYQSSEFQFIGFDELTQFRENQYRYLFSRLRRLEGQPVPLRMRAASNPGGIGHEWVRQRLVDKPESLLDRVFIPATINDNPYLDKPAYLSSLSRLDPITRQQLLNGDWSARETGGLFRREWFPIVDDAPPCVRKVRYWDFAATAPKQGSDPDYTVGALMGRSAEGINYLLDLQRLRATPQEVEQRVRHTAELDGKDVSIYIEQEPGASGAGIIDQYRRRILPAYPVRGDRVTGSKVTRAQPVAAQAEGGNVQFLRGPWLDDLFNELEAFPYGAHDDQVDALSGAYAHIYQELPSMRWL